MKRTIFYLVASVNLLNVSHLHCDAFRFTDLASSWFFKLNLLQNCKNILCTSTNAASNWENSLSKFRAISQIICCFFVSDTLWKPHGNTFLITKTNICRIHLLHAWISDLVRFLPQCEKGFVRFFGLYFCFADNLDFLTLPRCHLSKLGLLRNNCQIITQVGVHERVRIVFICRKIQVLLHSIEFKFVMWVDFFFKTVLLNL